MTLETGDLLQSILDFRSRHKYRRYLSTKTPAA